MKQQGTFKVQLRSLEDQLLTALSSGAGNILENENVLSTLENLKTQSNEIARKVVESENAMEEATAVAARFRPLASACAKLYFTLEALSDVHFLYQFSLRWFLEIFDTALSQPIPSVSAASSELGLVAAVAAPGRLADLHRALFQLVFSRVTRSLLSDHHTAVALRLAQIRLEEMGEEYEWPNAEMDFLCKSKITGQPADVPIGVWHVLSLPESQRDALSRLASLPPMSGLLAHIANNVNHAWTSFFSGDGPLPEGWEATSSRTKPALQALHRLLVVKCVRPDRMLDFSRDVARLVLGDACLLDRPLDLKAVVSTEGSSRSPLLLVSRPGYDASAKVESLAHGAPGYQSFAMGSEEGFQQADAAVTAAAKKGTWVLLKNVHLSPSWLASLEKRLHRLTPHPSFRLFLTAEIHPLLPSSLLRQSTRLVFEPPVGIKASLQRTFASLNPARVNKAPAERSRLYFLLAWLHAVVLERLRYVPVGWSKGFEFSETDQICAWDSIDAWVDSVAQGRANVAPEKLPWQALRTLLQDYLYGGRIDNEFDAQRLASFVNTVFTPKAFDPDFVLAVSYVPLTSEESGAGAAVAPTTDHHALITLPDVSGYDGFKLWIDRDMPDLRTPEVLGLPPAANRLLQTVGSEQMTRTVQLLQDVDVDELAPVVAPLTPSVSARGRSHVVVTPPWMVALAAQINAWLGVLPASGPILRRSAEALHNPLFRCLEREVNIASKLLQTVRKNLSDILSVVTGSEKATAELRALMKVLSKDAVPSHWRAVCRQPISIRYLLLFFGVFFFFELLQL